MWLEKVSLLLKGEGVERDGVCILAKHSPKKMSGIYILDGQGLGFWDG